MTLMTPTKTKTVNAIPATKLKLASSDIELSYFPINLSPVLGVSDYNLKLIYGKEFFKM
jgi:hypothetical protein